MRPTRIAAAIVPAPIPLSPWNSQSEITILIATSVISKQFFIKLNFLWVTKEITLTTPSPATRKMLAWTSRKTPKARITMLKRQAIHFSMVLSGVNQSKRCMEKSMLVPKNNVVMTCPISSRI